MTQPLERFALWLLRMCGWRREVVGKGEVVVVKCDLEGEAIMIKASIVQVFPVRKGSTGKGTPGG